MDFDSQDIIEMIREKGLRPTLARRQIMTVLLEKENHLSANEILNKLNRSGNLTSVATLYQNLAKLGESGLITRFMFPDGTIKYDSNLDIHHHMICNKCGLVMDISLDQPVDSGIKPKDFHTGKLVKNWEIDEIHYAVRGICPECLKRK